MNQPPPPTGPAPAPPTPGYGYVPPPPNPVPPPKQSRTFIISLAAAVVAGCLVGGGIALGSQLRPPEPTTQNNPTATDSHAQDVQLCTAYAAINSAMPKPQDTALQVLPAVNGLRLALNEAPSASRDIRSAITDVVHNYDALIADFGKVRSRGLAAPTPYDVSTAQESLERAWDVCQLGPR